MSPTELRVEQGSWAPVRCADLVGQERAERSFLDAFNSGRCAHAWILSGPRGVGKATLAHRIGRFLMVHGNAGDGNDGPGLFGNELPTAKPDSLATDLENPICQRIIAGGHTDFLCIERAVNDETGAKKRDISVDQVRAIGKLFALTPGEGGWRVVVIDGADDMNTNAQNALLKLLEEPPPQALLLLVVHNPGLLLPTLHSRCRHLALPPLAPAAMKTVLATQVPARGIELEADDWELLLQLADGSIGRAFSLAGDGGIEIYKDVRAVLGTLPNLDIDMLHKLGDVIARDRSGDKLRTLLEIIGWSLMERIRSSVPGSLEAWFSVWEKANRMLRETEGLNLDRKQLVLEIFLSIETAARG
ncbi:MAG: DNA polymerase III subunit delta' [Pseudomonadota bacterium]|nr:DNA polymerase III subunit delta' [Pseudomonadota bacterium]